MAWREELNLGKAYIEELYIGTYPGSLLSGTELSFVDGVTAGTAAASKALVLGTSKEIAQITTLSATTVNVGADGGTAGTLTIWPTTDANGQINIEAADNSGDDVVTLTGPAATSGDITITLPDTSGYLVAGTAQITKAEVDVLAGVTVGTAASSKALVLGTSGEIATIGAITTSGILTNSNAGASAIALTGAATVGVLMSGAATTGISMTGAMTTGLYVTGDINQAIWIDITPTNADRQIELTVDYTTSAKEAAYFTAKSAATSGETSALRLRGENKADSGTMEVRGLHAQGIAHADGGGQATVNAVYAEAIAKDSSTITTLRGLMVACDSEGTPTSLTDFFGAVIRVKTSVTPSSEFIGLRVECEKFGAGVKTDSLIDLKTTTWGAGETALGAVIDMTNVVGNADCHIRFGTGAINETTTEGDFWYDATEHKFQYYNGSGVKSIAVE